VSDDRLARVPQKKVDRRTNYESVQHEFNDCLTRVPDKFAINPLIAPSQKDSLGNQKFTRCVAIVQGFLDPLAPIPI
jgi:hypothetical protein